MSNQHTVQNQTDSEAAVQIAPSAVIGIICLYPVAIGDFEIADVAQCLETNQPAFWRAVDKETKIYQIPCQKVDANVLVSTLVKIGASHGHSVAVGSLKISAAGYSSPFEVWVGFCWRDPQQRIIVVRPNGIVATSTAQSGGASAKLTKVEDPFEVGMSIEDAPHFLQWFCAFVFGGVGLYIWWALSSK